MQYSKALLTFLLVTLFVLSLVVLLFELTLTRIFSIILWYDYAFMAISVAFFGLGIGALLVHILKNKVIKGPKHLPSKIFQSTIAFAVSLPVFLIVIGHIIPPSTSFIYLFYLTSSIPFFFAGMSMAMIYLAMSREISKLYFADLAGAAAATLILDPLMRVLGAESGLLLLSLIAIVPSLIAAFILLPSHPKKIVGLDLPPLIESKIKLYGVLALAFFTVLLAANIQVTNILAIQLGDNKGLRHELANPSIHDHLTRWNSFSRIDVIRHNYDIGGKSNPLAEILIDADAVTPVFRWNSSSSYADNLWIRHYMDYMPYQISPKPNSTLVIGGGGGEDILVALAGGSKKVTAVELNPLVVSTAKQFGGNLYDRSDVNLFIDDGRRFISATTAMYDIIVIKLVDSWAAQLAGGYALSENYLYTVEAFKQYLHHLNGANGMLVMVRWNFELPRLMPLVVESLRQEKRVETGKDIQDIGKQIVVVEDRPGLYFGSNPQRTIYPILVMVKNSAFTTSQLDLIKERIIKDNAKVIAMPYGFIQPPYDALLLSRIDTGYYQPLQVSYARDPGKTSLSMLKPPTDDSPFYFAREKIPKQMIVLVETVLAVSAVLAALLIYYTKLNRIQLTSSSRFHILFVIFIGLGFIFLEITFIQKFLLLLGTPIMALTVILFSVLLSSGIGAYLSGRLFRKNPFKAIVISIPLLAGIVLAYYSILPQIIDSAIVLSLLDRIALTFVLLSPAGLLMGFQFPSITRMTSSSTLSATPLMKEEYGSGGNQDITLLWGVNIIASVIGSVLTAVSSMVIGFSGNLLIGLGLYLGALAAAIAFNKIRPIAKQIYK
jgi:Spermine/spermidine synthase domain